MHKFGINNRYLGVIFEKMNVNNFNSNLILKSIFLRSIKKLIRKILRNIEEYQIKTSLSHIFNLIFSNENCLKELNEKANKNKEKLNTVEDKLLNYDQNGIISNT